MPTLLKVKPYSNLYPKTYPNLRPNPIHTLKQTKIHTLIHTLNHTLTHTLTYTLTHTLTHTLDPNPRARIFQKSVQIDQFLDIIYLFLNVRFEIFAIKSGFLLIFFPFLARQAFFPFLVKISYPLKTFYPPYTSFPKIFLRSHSIPQLPFLSTPTLIFH